MNKLTMITRENCFYCNQAKEILKDHNKQYKELQIGKDIERDEVVTRYPDNKVLPIVIVDDTVIGSYAELLNYLFPAIRDFEDTK